jgi:hypothetical protein
MLVSHFALKMKVAKFSEVSAKQPIHYMVSQPTIRNKIAYKSVANTHGKHEIGGSNVVVTKLSKNQQKKQFSHIYLDNNVVRRL